MWFSSCWYKMKKTITMIPAGIEWRNATEPTMMAASVAPASGIRSRIATISPSARANGTPVRSRTIVVSVPATKLIKRLPVT
jgi:hypothetical protein